jgi:hypothetical protein
MDKILIILNGESFKSGGTHNRNRGNDDFANYQQKLASESHIRLIEYLKNNFSLESKILINSYEASGHEKSFLEWYGESVIYHKFHTSNFADELEFITDTINRLKEIDLTEFTYCLFLRPDLYLKKFFLEKLIFDEKVRYAFVDSNPLTDGYRPKFTHYKCVVHGITLVPKIFFNLLLEKKVWNWHSSASEFIKELGVDDSCTHKYVDFFVNSLHWASHSIEWNPIFAQCARLNNLSYNQCEEVQEFLPVDKWIYASRGLFFDSLANQKILVKNCTFYDGLRENELLENPGLDKFYKI